MFSFEDDTYEIIDSYAADDTSRLSSDAPDSSYSLPTAAAASSKSVAAVPDNQQDDFRSNMR